MVNKLTPEANKANNNTIMNFSQRRNTTNVMYIFDRSNSRTATSF